MKRIWKFPIVGHGFNHVAVPVGSRFLSIGRQRDVGDEVGASLMMWVEVGDELTKTEDWGVCIVVTGETFVLANVYRYVGTVTLRDDPPFVVHAYLRGERC
jgi:hypothetical protein